MWETSESESTITRQCLRIFIMCVIVETDTNTRVHAIIANHLCQLCTKYDTQHNHIITTKQPINTH